MMAGDPDDELNSVQLELNSGYHELDVDGGGGRFCTETTSDNSRVEKRFKGLSATL